MATGKTSKNKRPVSIAAGVGAAATADSPESPPDAAFPVVGIGASAGGLAAFEAFFSGMPAGGEPGMAFVLVQHLAPDHKSLLTDLIRRYTPMQVFEVDDGMVVQPDCVYIIPPNHDMAFLNGTLQLLEPSSPRGQRLPIDFFFRSLAQDLGQRAIGIVLSGTGSDGSQGVRAIKGSGGMVMVQSPDSTEFDGMPLSAIATGLVDYQLPPAEMPARLAAFAKHAFGQTRVPAAVETPLAETTLKKIFVLLRSQTGHDFSQYKPSTINRRVERRMAVHQIDLLESYVRFLQQTPAEVEALFRDLLIGVTNFFRDPDAFKVLEEHVLPKLFANKPVGSAIRVWCAGCSTGEEAYSIAILLRECMERLKQHYAVQIFATDIDSRAIATARAGIYPASIAADISPERLARHFSADADGSTYRVHKSLRDMLVFSEHDIIKDPPFSRLDLLTCRNVLIYLNVSLQKKIIPLFHYALQPGGVLFLGTSEGVGEFSESFAVLDRKAKIYQRKHFAPTRERGGVGRLLPPMAAMEPMPAPRAGGQRPASPAKLPMRELTEQALLRQLAPTSALVNEQGDIYYLYGRTGMFLEPAPGEPGTSNILKMAREGLRRELAKALKKSASNRETVRCPGLRVKTNGHFTFTDLTVCPVPVPTGACLYLAILEDAPEPEAPTQAAAQPGTPGTAGTPETETDAEIRISELLAELRSKDEALRSAQEELDISTQELKSSIEEMQSVNEELQSTNEEMETSKEELQSVNEELNTVNIELQTKVADLSRANNDMNNLLAGTGIGTVFVDHDLRILRFTPAASAIINLIQGDIGRPVSHIVSNMVGYDSLSADVREVLDSLTPKAVDVRTTNGKWHTMRILPYRTLDNVIEGAVISFIDITEAVQIREQLHKANEHLRLAVVVRDAHDAITVQDLSGRTLAWNPGAERMYGWTEAEALQMNVRQRIPEPLRDKALATLRQLSQSEVIEPYLTERLNKKGSVMSVSIVSTALLDESGEIYAIATTERTMAGEAR
ncbi:chemotaxis protein CheR [Arenimonas soli]|uniref:protein-glutamate O-methyltransferase n=1 Tax=Arenimonas soli TaxID=2269504 RepID=A0ABQ1HCC6_9GAMM|nr:CheR family methyltransferase [Arenimonas soli]GGA70860.1 chemotaxis protein CheR [Arenimonas soli]